MKLLVFPWRLDRRQTQAQEDPALAIYFANIVFVVLIPSRRFYLHITVVICTNSIDYKKQEIFS